MISRTHVPVVTPEKIFPDLGKGELYWRKGYSAFEHAHSWALGNGIPKPVRRITNQGPEWSKATLVNAFFERDVQLTTPGRPSQTDLIVIADLGSELGVIAVEGKVEEPFGELVSEWRNSEGKSRRFKGLCNTFELDSESVESFRYQLFHRTASAIYEAQRWHAAHAIMLVHSFSAKHTSFPDFAAFADLIRMPVAEINSLSCKRVFEGVSLRLGWVADDPIP